MLIFNNLRIQNKCIRFGKIPLDFVQRGIVMKEITNRFFFSSFAVTFKSKTKKHVFF